MTGTKTSTFFAYWCTRSCFSHPRKVDREVRMNIITIRRGCRGGPSDMGPRGQLEEQSPSAFGAGGIAIITVTVANCNEATMWFGPGSDFMLLFAVVSSAVVGFETGYSRSLRGDVEIARKGAQLSTLLPEPPPYV